MLVVKTHCTLGLNLVSYNRKCAYLSFENSTPPQLTSAQWSLFRLWQFKNEEMEAFCYHCCAIHKCAAHSSRLLQVKNKRWLSKTAYSTIGIWFRMFKTSVPLSSMTTYRMSLISAGSIAGQYLAKSAAVFALPWLSQIRDEARRRRGVVEVPLHPGKF